LHRDGGREGRTDVELEGKGGEAVADRRPQHPQEVREADESRGLGFLDVVVHVGDAEGVVEGATDARDQLGDEQQGLGREITVGLLAVLVVRPVQAEELPLPLGGWTRARVHRSRLQLRPVLLGQDERVLARSVEEVRQHRQAAEQDYLRISRSRL
jgi:hypothetical protein